jgi:hypothetical protein
MTVKQRSKNKKWTIYYYIRVNGKLKLRTEAVSTRKDVALARLKECKNLVRQGIDPKVGKIKQTPESPIIPVTVSTEVLTLEQFLPIFLKLHGRNQSESMQESYRSSLGHLIPVFGKMKLDQITKKLVQTYMANRLEERIIPHKERERTRKPELTTKEHGDCKGTVSKKEVSLVSKATINREVACLKVILSRAELWEYIPKNPIHGLKSLKEAPIRERYLTREEYQRLVLAAPSYLQDIIVFALATGMRKDLQRGQIRYSCSRSALSG